MSNNFQLVETKYFGEVAFQCYQEDSYTNDQGIGNEFWATCEQIGQLLGYAQPEVAITKIHQRNQERLNKFSTITKLVRVEGKVKGAILINIGKSHNNGTPVTQLKWYSTVVPSLVDYVNSHDLKETMTTLKALSFK